MSPPQSEVSNAAEIPALSPEPTETDHAIYRQLIRIDLTPEQEERILTPPEVYAKQRTVLAVHWHPEFVPMDLIRRRIETMFPERDDELIIPTQHNELMSYDGFTGVEVDCYSAGFQRKVQLLMHFANENIEGTGSVFRAMLAHTANYRGSQLYEFMDSIVDPRLNDRVEEAAAGTGAGDDLIRFVRVYVSRLRQMLDRYERETPQIMFKNKLIRNYFDALRDQYDDRLINHAQFFLKAVKTIVKRHFALDYFYRTEEVIEEARSLGAGIVIPHPEQFWPVLLADLDIDGIEVWNPQSFEYTRFLIEVVERENRTRRRGERPLLITMGDDCHMGEKVKDPRYQDAAKAGREIGYQPPWDDLTIRKGLIVAGANRHNVIKQYRERLG